MNQPYLSIAFIGAGNVATHLSAALSKKGHTICQVFSRTEVSARELAEKRSCPFTTSLSEVTPNADLYIVSVKDAVLEQVLPLLVKCNPNALFVHTAGSVSISVWNGLAQRYGVIYPMQTFSKQKPVDFTNLPVFIEANTPTDCQLLKGLMEGISRKVYQASSEQRRYLHIAAVFACNFSNHMYAICHHLLEKHQLPFETMLPLIDETARKVHTLSPAEAQTGPARRNDENVMKQHLQILENESDLAEIYQLISKHINQSEYDKL